MRLLRSYRLWALIGFILLFVIVQFILSLLLHPPDALLAFTDGDSAFVDRISGGSRRVGAEPAVAVHISCNFSSLPADSQDAFSRARSNSCKQRIVDTACSAQRGTLYPTEPIQRTCPRRNDEEFAKYYGCFHDNMNDRDMAGGMTPFKDTNSPLKCVYHCLQEGFAYAGLQYGTECWCGASFGRFGVAREEQCNMTCPGKSKRAKGGKLDYCGGFRVQNVYSTGVGAVPNSKVDYVEPRTVPPHKRARIVYVLTLNGRNYRQVLRLFKRIYHVNHYYFMHVDKRSDFLHRKLSFLESLFTNVRLSPTRHAPIWGGTSLLTALLDAMRELIQGSFAGWNWTYLINLSESDYPLKTDSELTSFLSQYAPNSFIRSHGSQTSTFVRKQGLAYTFVECDSHMYRLGERAVPPGLRIDGGSDWFAFHRRFVHFIVDILFKQAGTFKSQFASTDDEILLSKLYHYYNYTLLPAESFFHFALQNSRFCTETVFDNNLRFTNWHRNIGCGCQYKRVVDWCGCSPSVIRATELSPRLDALFARSTYFARKFDSTIDHGTYNLLDAYLDAVNQRIDRGINVTTQGANYTTEVRVRDEHAEHDHGEPDADTHSRLQLIDSNWYSLFQHADPVLHDFVVEMRHFEADDDEQTTERKYTADKVDVASQYDAHSTMLHSLMRIAIVELHVVAPHCEFVAVRPLELTLYRVADTIEGVLLKYEAFVEPRAQHHDHAQPPDAHQPAQLGQAHGGRLKRSRQPDVLEAWFRLETQLTKTDSTDLLSTGVRLTQPNPAPQQRKVLNFFDPPENHRFNSKSNSKSKAKSKQARQAYVQPQPAANPKPQSLAPELTVNSTEALHCLERFESIEAGTEHDRKEAALRGTPGLLGIFTEIQLLHRWHVANFECNVRFILFDPTDEPLHSAVVTVPPRTAHSDVYTPLLTKPLLPGYWTLVIGALYRKPSDQDLHLLVYTKYRFLVSPHTFFNGAPLEEPSPDSSRSQLDLISVINSGPSTQSVDANVRRFQHVLSDEATRTSRREEAIEHGRVHGEELLSWTQSLYANAFKFRAACLFEVDAPENSRRSAADGMEYANVYLETDNDREMRASLRERADSKRNRVCPDLDFCQRTLWSSFAPDENSEIGLVNPRTGRLR